MSFEENTARFAAWLNAREADQRRRLGFTYSERLRDLLKTEHAECLALQAAFNRLVVAPLRPVEQAMFLARVDIAAQRLAESAQAGMSRA